jgi:hypothetical protein
MTRIAFGLVALLTACGQILCAQSVPAANASGDLQNDPHSPAYITDDTQPADGSSGSAPVAASLDGSGTIALSHIRRAQLFVGATLGYGYDTDPLNLGRKATRATATFSVSPYMGLMTGNTRTQFVLQYHPTISRFTHYEGQSMQFASAKVASHLSPRLDLSLAFSGNRGVDSLRMLQPARLNTTDGALVAGPGSAAYLPNAGTATNLDGALGLRYSVSRRGSLDLTFTDAYNSTPSLHHAGSVTGVDLHFSHSVTPLLSVLVYSQGAQYYGDLNCTAVGLGAGVRWQPQEGTTLSARGGPQVDSPGCNSQQGFAYSASFTRVLPHGAQLYLMADRQPVISFLGSGLWQDDASLGYQRTIQTSSTLSFDVGLIHSSTLVDVNSYKGTFYDVSYVRSLMRGMSFQCGYRRFVGNSGETQVNRNVLMAAITFTPNRRPQGQ